MSFESLDLDNFECEFALNTPYVLTSPRSLKACSKLGFKPKELVYRGLEEFEEIYCDLPLSTIYTLYDQNETKRQEKLLMCRAMRDKIMMKKSSKNSKSLDSSNKNLNHVTIKRYSPKIVNFSQDNLQSGSSEIVGLHYSSDTESNEGFNNEVQGKNDQNDQNDQNNENNEQSDEDEEILYSTRSVPDLRDNLHFSKTSPRSPRSPRFCPCQAIGSNISREQIYSNYMNRYSDILGSDYLNDEDRKIMECLILKKGRELEFEKKSQQFHNYLEKERLQKYRERQKSTQSLLDKIAEKRRIENEENARRYLQIEEKVQEQRKGLLNYLQNKDQKVQKYLDDLNYQKKKHLLEKQREEALRQLEVGNTLERLIEQDQRHRDRMRETLQKRMEEAETRKRRREKDYWRHLVEMNRLEEINRQIKIEKIESANRQVTEDLRQQIEEKEHKAHMNYLNNIKHRRQDLSSGAVGRNLAQERARALHLHLLQGLQEWHTKVAELHTEAQKRAEVKHDTEIQRKRSRALAQRVCRQERNHELLKRVRESEEQRRELYKLVIENKNEKSSKVKDSRERNIRLNRARSQHGAELRAKLREQIDPETFDKKCSRVEIESRFLRRSMANRKNNFINFNLNSYANNSTGNLSTTSFINGKYLSNNTDIRRACTCCVKPSNLKVQFKY